MIKPSKDYLYVFKFPKFITTWRLKDELPNGNFVFFTSTGGVTKETTPKRFEYICRYCLISKIKLESLNLNSVYGKRTSEYITVKVETPVKTTTVTLYPKEKKEYTKQDLDELLDLVADSDFEF